jgi:hypothetical protein
MALSHPSTFAPLFTLSCRLFDTILLTFLHFPAAFFLLPSAYILTNFASDQRRATSDFYYILMTTSYILNMLSQSPPKAEWTESP